MRVDTMTAGEAAKAAEVAPRTITRWCDEFGLPHYRVPGTGGDRRIFRDDLAKFMAENGMVRLAQRVMAIHRTLLVGLPVHMQAEAAGHLQHQLLYPVNCDNSFDAGRAFRKTTENVVIDFGGLGRKDATFLALRLREERPQLCLVGLFPEDMGEGEVLALASDAKLTHARKHPIHPATLVEVLTADLYTATVAQKVAQKKKGEKRRKAVAS